MGRLREPGAADHRLHHPHRRLGQLRRPALPLPYRPRGAGGFDRRSRKGPRDPARLSRLTAEDFRKPAAHPHRGAPRPLACDGGPARMPTKKSCSLCHATTGRTLSEAATWFILAAMPRGDIASADRHRARRTKEGGTIHGEGKEERQESEEREGEKREDEGEICEGEKREGGEREEQEREGGACGESKAPGRSGSGEEAGREEDGSEEDGREEDGGSEIGEETRPQGGRPQGRGEDDEGEGGEGEGGEGEGGEAEAKDRQAEDREGEDGEADDREAENRRG